MKRLLKWLRWHLANILSASRYFSILIPFEPWDLSVDTTLVVIILLGATDLLDGWVARMIKNSKGIGMAIDASADKVMILSVSAWILRRVKIINPKMIKMIIWGEILPFFVGLIGIGLAWKKNQKRGLSSITK